MLIVQFNGILWQNVWASNFIKKKYEDHKCHNEVGIGFKDDNITISRRCAFVYATIKQYNDTLISYHF
jgi:hypothetical protein